MSANSISTYILLDNYVQDKKEYDSDHKLLKHEACSLDKKRIHLSEYEYYENGVIKSIKSYTKDDLAFVIKIISDYDNKGNLVKQKRDYTSGSDVTLYSEGNPVKMTKYAIDGIKASVTEYNDIGSPARVYTYNSKGEIDYISEYVYTESGILTEERILSADGTIANEIKYSQSA